MSMLRVWLEYAWKQPRVWLEYAYSMPTVCLETKNLFPYGEQNIPTLGTKHSQPGNKTGFLRPFSSKRAELERRLLVSLFLMLVLGSTSVWGQDLSGIYYIASDIDSYNNENTHYSSSGDIANHCYLVPAEYESASELAYYTVGNAGKSKPYLTTYRTNRDNNSIWILKKKDNFYQIIHALTGKYVEYAIPDSNKPTRRVVHLIQQTESEASGNTNTLFSITDDNGILIVPNALSEAENRYLNVCTHNYEKYYADSNKDNSGGLIGVWKETTNLSLWHLENAKLNAPTISVDKDANTFSIADANGLVEGYTIRYTTGDGTQEAPTATTGEEYSTPIIITESMTVKAVVVRYGLVLTEVATKVLTPSTQCEIPILTYNHTGKTVTITNSWPTDATIYYSLNENDTPNQEYTTAITIPDDCNIVRAIATKEGKDNSPVASITRVAAPTFGFDDIAQGFTITCATEGATIHYTTDGTEPTTSSTEYSGAVTITSETTVKAIAVKDGFIYSRVVENTYSKTVTPTITFDQYTNTFTLASTTEGATIHYTTDGTAPTTTSPTYSDVVSLTAAATIKAMAIKIGVVNSEISEKVIGKSNTPVISYSGDDEITIISDPTDAEVYYTTNNAAPTKTSGTKYENPISLISTEDIVQAIVFEADKVSSDVATLTVHVHMGSSNPYLIQSQNNGWTTGDHQGFHYYMIPGDPDTDSNTTINTTSLLRSTMVWYFKYAGNDGTYDYYYIVNKNSEGDKRLRYNTNIYLEEYASANDDSFKFRILEYNTTGSYNIIPKGLTSGSMYVHKGNNNNNAASVTLNNSRTSGNSLWKFVKEADINKTAPFEVSTDETVHYYKIQNYSANTFFIVPPGSQSVKATTSSTEADEMNWYFKVAGTTDNDWLTYYHIINGVTGEYLYYTGGTASATNTASFEMRRDYDSNNAERYQFAWARSTTADVYFIVPAMLKDEALNTISSIYRYNNNTLATNKDRNVGALTWKFVTSSMTLATPAIIYDAATNKAEITCTTPGTTVYYTTDGTDPTTSATKYEYTEKFGLDEGVNMIEAIAIKDTEISNVATKKIPVQTTTSNVNRPYLIRNNGNAWTESNPFFYMIPDTYNNNANTSSLPRATMEWYFLDAGLDGNGNQCFYIKNAVAKSTNEKDLYLHRNSGTISIKEIDETDDGFKFYLIERTSGYSIVAYGTTTVYLNKNSGNNQTGALNTSNSTTADASLWNFVLKKDFDKTSPIEESSSTSAHYYKIRSNRTDGNEFYIISPETGTTYPTVSSTADEVKKSWYFKNAGTDGWATFYNIVCAETGEYLYCTATQANTYNVNVRPFELSSVDDERSQFILVKSTFEGSYFIVPRIYKDTQLNNVCSILNRDDTYMRTDVNRNSRANTWIFESADMFCKEPVFDLDGDGNVTISCLTPASEITFTADGSDPQESTTTTTYSNQSWSKETRICVKAFAKLKDTPSVKSEVVTLLNCPDIDLDVYNYVYNKTAKEPAVTKVYIGDVVATAGTYSAPVYTNNTNAGTEIVKPTVTITDAVADDRLVIANAKKEFVIRPLEVTLNWANTTLTYNRSAQTPTATVTNCIEGDECNVTVAVEGETSHTDVGDYTAIAQSLDNTNYALPTENTMAFSIIRKSIGDGTSLAAGFSVTMGDGDNPTFTVKDGTEELIEDTEYEVSDPVEEEGNQVWTVTGINNYTGAAKVMRISLSLSKTGATSTATASNVEEVTPYRSSVDLVTTGLDPYKVTYVNMTNHTITIQKLNYVPKDVPVLLLTDIAEFNEEQTYSYALTPVNVAAADVADTSDNLLKQVMSEAGQVVGFGQVYMYYKGKFVITTDGTMEKGKFYVDNPNFQGGGISNAPLHIVFDDTTDVGEVKWMMDDGKDDKWYSLDGRCLNGKPTKKGLYLKDGKKIVVK